jgi:hypothetical protein
MFCDVKNYENEGQDGMRKIKMGDKHALPIYIYIKSCLNVHCAPSFVLLDKFIIYRAAVEFL